MKRIFLLLFITTSVVRLSAQKLEGVYVGEIISHGNILVVSNKGTEVTGSVYLNKTNALDFSGSYNDHVLKGLVRLTDGGLVSLEGKLENNPSKLVLSPDSIGKRARILFKISSNSKYKIADLFSDQNDPMLLGTWETVKQINRSGELLEGKFSWEFVSGGKLYHRNITLPSKLASLPRREGFDPYKEIQLSWAKKGQQLTIRYTSLPGAAPNNYGYFFKGDTLKMRATDGLGAIDFIRK